MILSRSNGTLRPVAELVDVVGGGTPSRSIPEFWEGDIPWASPKDIKRPEVCDTAEHISCAALAQSSCGLIEPPAVLMVVRGMILAHTLPVAVSRVPLAVNQDLKALRPRECVDVEYLAFVLRGAAHELLQQVEIAGHGTRRLPTQAWQSLRVPVPSLEEQYRIVTRIKELLPRVAEVADLRQAVIDEAAHLRDSLVLEGLGLESCRDWTNVEAHVGRFAWRPLEEVCVLLGRGRHSKQGVSAVHLIKTRHVWPDGLRDYSDYTLDTHEARRVSPALIVRPGDTLLACSARGSLGRCAFVSDAELAPATVDTHVAILRANPSKLRSRFLFEYLRSPVGKFRLVSAEAGGRWHEERIHFRYAELNLVDLKRLKIPVPDLARQDELLARILPSRECVVQLQQEQRMAQLREKTLPYAILRKVFAGEL